MKVANIVKFLIVILIILFMGICINNYVIRVNEKEVYKYTYIWETIDKLNKNELKINTVDSIGIVETLDILFYDMSMWSKLPLTESFIKKFKGPNGIIRKYDKYESIDMGVFREYSKNNVIEIMCTERDSIISRITGKSVTTIYTFEYLLNANNQLDDLILLKEVDIDSMTAETYDVREY